MGLGLELWDSAESYVIRPCDSAEANFFILNWDSESTRTPPWPSRVQSLSFFFLASLSILPFSLSSLLMIVYHTLKWALSGLLLPDVWISAWEGGIGMQNSVCTLCLCYLMSFCLILYHNFCKDHSFFLPHVLIVKYFFISCFNFLI